jgi:outer membrane protein assembly factor BamB
MKEDLIAVRYGSGNKLGGGPRAANSGSNGDNGNSGTGFFDGMAPAGVEPRWKFKTEDEIRSSPTSYRNVAFVGSYDTNIWAINLETGEMVWKRPTDGGIASSPLIDTEYKQILFGSEDYTFNAVDMRDGRVNWTYTTGDKIRGTGRLADGHVFFGSDDGKLYALVASNGRYLWEYDSGAQIRSTPFVTNDRIIFGNEAGEVVALELSSTRKWSFRTRRSVTSSPVVDRENICYVGSMDGFLYAIDSDNGYSQWRFRTNGPVISSPAIADGFVYFGSADGKVYCVNATTGKERWTFSTDKPVVSSPKIFDGIVYIGGTDKKLHALDTRTGKELWSFEAGGEITSTPHITEDLILFGSLDKTLYSLPMISR